MSQLSVRRLRLPLLAATLLLCAIGVHRLYDLTVATALGQRRDERLTDRAVSVAAGLPTEVLGTVSVASLAAALLAACGIALVRRRGDLAVAAVLVVGGANVTTQVLKSVLDRPDEGFSTLNSFPSGHTTAAASAAAALLLVAPGVWRPVVAVVGAAFAAWVGLATVVASWHRVSDAVAAGLVVLGWLAAALLLVPRASRGAATGAPGLGGPPARAMSPR